MPRKENDKLWTIDDVADYLQVKASVVKYWIHNERLPHIKLGKHYRFDFEDIREWIEQQKDNSPNKHGKLKTII